MPTDDDSDVTLMLFVLQALFERRAALGYKCILYDFVNTPFLRKMGAPELGLRQTMMIMIRAGHVVVQKVHDGRSVDEYEAARMLMPQEARLIRKDRGGHMPSHTFLTYAVEHGSVVEPFWMAIDSSVNDPILRDTIAEVTPRLVSPQLEYRCIECQTTIAHGSDGAIRDATPVDALLRGGGESRVLCPACHAVVGRGEKLFSAALFTSRPPTSITAC